MSDVIDQLVGNKDKIDTKPMVLIRQSPSVCVVAQLCTLLKKKIKCLKLDALLTTVRVTYAIKYVKTKFASFN